MVQWQEERQLHSYGDGKEHRQYEGGQGRLEGRSFSVISKEPAGGALPLQ